MPRKSKQASSGHLPLTHYERNKKFKSSTYHGTTVTRLSNDNQYTPFGFCHLSLTPILDSITNPNSSGGGIKATVSPSGYLYSKQAIYQYLLTQKQKQKQQQQEKDVQQQEDDAQKEEEKAEGNDLKRTSYWLPDMQPSQKRPKAITEQIIERPLSPNSNQPLRRKDLKSVQLLLHDSSNDANTNTKREIACAISGKIIKCQQAIAYWTVNHNKNKSKNDEDDLGTVVLKEVYDMTIQKDTATTTTGNKNDFKKQKNDSDEKKKIYCPLTSKRIRKTILLQRSIGGNNGNNTQIKKYKPTIT